jgi:hypothetical protein
MKSERRNGPDPVFFFVISRYRRCFERVCTTGRTMRKDLSEDLRFKRGELSKRRRDSICAVRVDPKR